MKIFTDLDNNFLVETKSGELPLGDAFRVALAKDGRTMNKLEGDAGLSHGSFSRRGESTVKNLLCGFMEMGYDLELVKKD